LLLLLKNNMKKIFLSIIIFILILLALFPRSVEVLNGNPIFGFDQGRDYLEVKDIVNNHKLTLIGAELGAGEAGVSYIFQGPGFYYLLSIPYILFHGNPAGSIYLMWVLSMLSLVIGFFIGITIWGKLGGVILTTLLAVSSPLINQARFEWNANATAFFILLTFYSVYLFIKTKQNRFILLSAFLSGFLYNFEFAVAIPLCLGFIILTPYICRKKFSQYFLLFVGFFLAFSPMFLFEVRHGFMGIKSFISYLLHVPKNEITMLSRWTHFQDVWNTFVFNFANTFPGNGVLPVIILLLIFFGLFIWYLLQEKDMVRKTFNLYVGSLIPLSFIIFNIFRNSIYQHYILELNVAYIIMLTSIVMFIITQNYKKTMLVFTAYGIILLSFAAYSSYKTTTYDYKDYGGTAKLKGKVDALDYVYNDAKGKPFGLFVFSPPIYTYPYDYIILWHEEPRYHYLPGQTKKGTFYLLIEPDGSKPWSYNGWLETVIKSGKIIYTKTLPSGFIVQKREG